MATDDLKTGTVDGTTGTTALAADGSVTEPTGGSAGEESIEELRARLVREQNARAELERQKAQLLSEKSETERLRREAEARIASGAPSTPPTGATADPFAAHIATAQALANAYPENTYEGAQARATLASLQAQQFNFQQQQRNQAVTVELLTIPDAKRAAVIEKLKTGAYNTVQSALEAVEGKSQSDEVAALRNKVAEMERRLANGGAAPREDVSVSTRSAGAAATGKRVVPLSEWTRVQAAGGPEAVKMEQDYYNGALELDHGR